MSVSWMSPTDRSVKIADLEANPTCGAGIVGLRRMLRLVACGLLFALAVATGGLLALAEDALDLPPQAAIDADVLLKEGLIYDGSGDEPFRGSVAIRGDRIVAVGTFPVGRIKMAVDCSGLVISPGFIDLHNHSDQQMIDRRTRANTNYLTQGCTTIVTGNCGAGPIEVAKYYNQIDVDGAGTNVLHLVPHGALRARVVGTAYRAASSDDIAAMQGLARQAMREGAWGLSSGLIYVPSSYASTDELVQIARVVGDYGGLYASHIRDEGASLLAAIDEALEVGQRAEVPVHISHFKASGRDAWGLVRRATDMIERSRELGQTVTADQYPYTALSTSLEATIIPPWARAGGHDAINARLSDPLRAARIRGAMIDALGDRDDGAMLRLARFDSKPEWVGKSLTEIAADRKSDVLEVATYIVQQGSAMIVEFSMNEDDVRYVMRQPWVATASDGRAYVPDGDKPQPRSYGTFSRKVGYYARQEGVIGVSAAIRSCTGLPADILHLTDRGYIRPGQAADLAVLDLEKFIDLATYDEPHQYSEGVVHVFVNGRAAIFQAQLTGILAGRAIRKKSPQSKPQKPIGVIGGGGGEE